MICSQNFKTQIPETTAFRIVQCVWIHVYRTIPCPELCLRAYTFWKKHLAMVKYVLGSAIFSRHNCVQNRSMHVDPRVSNDSVSRVVFVCLCFLKKHLAMVQYVLGSAIFSIGALKLFQSYINSLAYFIGVWISNVYSVVNCELT